MKTYLALLVLMAPFSVALDEFSVQFDVIILIFEQSLILIPRRSSQMLVLRASSSRSILLGPQTPRNSYLGDLLPTPAILLIESPIFRWPTISLPFSTCAGVKVHPSWAPIGAARFKELVESGFYDDTRFFRVIPSFMVQFGLSGDPSVSSKWRSKPINDEPVSQSNKPGYITFAKTGASLPCMLLVQITRVVNQVHPTPAPHNSLSITQTMLV